MTLTGKKLKVMHFVSGFKNGGVEQVLLNYTKYINRNYDIDEYIVYQHEADAKKLELSKKLGNKMYRIPFKKDHPFKNLFATYKLIKKEKPDVVHAHMNLVNFYPLMIAKLLGVPVRISHSHIANDNIKSNFVSIFKKLNILFATELIACGEAAGKYMYGNRNFTILYNAIEQEEYKYNPKSREKIRNMFNISKNTVLLGSIGRNVEQKNQKFLVDVFSDYQKINKDSILMLVGNGPLSSELDRYIAEKGCKDKIIRIKRVLSTKELYSAFDIFLLPSLYEGLPVVAVESQASGLISLLTDSIDKSVSYTKFVKFLSINKGTKTWIKNIEDHLYKNDPRKCDFNNKYNIKLHYKDLYNIYAQSIGK